MERDKGIFVELSREWEASEALPVCVFQGKSRFWESRMLKGFLQDSCRMDSREKWDSAMAGAAVLLQGWELRILPNTWIRWGWIRREIPPEFPSRRKIPSQIPESRRFPSLCLLPLQHSQGKNSLSTPNPEMNNLSNEFPLFPT